MASARKTGTNEQVTTYDSGGGETYDALGDWEAATDTDHVADEETDVLEWVAGNHDDQVQIDGSTNDSAYFRIMRPVTVNHGGICVASASYASFTTSASNFGIRIAENYTQVQDIVGATSNGSFNGSIFRWLGAASFSAYIGCLHDGGSQIGTFVIGFFSNSRTDSDEVFMINCASQAANQQGVSVSSGIVNAYNCTIEDAGDRGFNINSGATLNAKNCISDNPSSARQDYGGLGTTNLTRCLAGDTTGNPAELDSLNPTYVNVGAGDLHLVVGSDGDDDGDDLSSDADYPFDTDIDDVTITNWPCGYDDPTVVGVIVPDDTLAPTVQLANSGGMIGAVNV